VRWQPKYSQHFQDHNLLNEGQLQLSFHQIPSQQACQQDPQNWEDLPDLNSSVSVALEVEQEEAVVGPVLLIQLWSVEPTFPMAPEDAEKRVLVIQRLLNAAVPVLLIPLWSKNAVELVLTIHLGLKNAVELVLMIQLELEVWEVQKASKLRCRRHFVQHDHVRNDGKGRQKEERAMRWKLEEECAREVVEELAYGEVQKRESLCELK
jgi:hypothetical protein